MTRACTDPVRAAVGDVFDDAEIDAMLDRLAARYARLKAGSARARQNDPGRRNLGFRAEQRQPGHHATQKARRGDGREQTELQRGGVRSPQVEVEPRAWCETRPSNRIVAVGRNST